MHTCVVNNGLGAIKLIYPIQLSQKYINGGNEFNNIPISFLLTPDANTFKYCVVAYPSIENVTISVDPGTVRSYLVVTAMID